VHNLWFEGKGKRALSEMNKAFEKVNKNMNVFMKEQEITQLIAKETKKM